MLLNDLVTRFVALGSTRIFFKCLSENDNSKQQIYLGSSFEVLTLFPYKDVVAHPNVKNPNFKASIDLFWVGPDYFERAPHSQLILYPEYPEVRLSGFLRGCRSAPNEYLRPIPKDKRRGTDGRVLFFGTTADGKTLVHLAAAGSDLANHAFSLRKPGTDEKLFIELPISGPLSNKDVLLLRLREIHQKGFVDSIRLDRTGNVVPYAARNGGGYTLEAMLGIIPNGQAAPDFMGWEVKAYSGNRITLMTPEPNGGYYGREGVAAFVRRFGRSVEGRDQLYFTGVHRFQQLHPSTGLTLTLNGYDTRKGTISDVSGAIELVTREGEVASAWGFAHLLEHWNRKHASAVYVPYENSRASPPKYRYLSPVLLGERTDFAKCLAAISKSRVVFDPGSKIDNVSTSRPRVKARSQFRITESDLPLLYESFTPVRL